mmetsp:Transcript_52170/g.136386  ORF Transcript_52170/g.136386 Transcript_52170/m.136386 type:complete len:243 (-) Transcript_52170:570-1298(-)
MRGSNTCPQCTQTPSNEAQPENSPQNALNQTNTQRPQQTVYVDAEAHTPATAPCRPPLLHKTAQNTTSPNNKRFRESNPRHLTSHAHGQWRPRPPAAAPKHRRFHGRRSATAPSSYAATAFSSSAATAPFSSAAPSSQTSSHLSSSQTSTQSQNLVTDTSMPPNATPATFAPGDSSRPMISTTQPLPAASISPVVPSYSASNCTKQILPALEFLVSSYKRAATCSPIGDGDHQDRQTILQLL